mmetsp:Transcript_19129/g.40519  ORF Transcript_19129/g.40519 Transcript_19129/m.40519 type:complete len:302 (+) Transcript_19129:182-1087(+)
MMLALCSLCGAVITAKTAAMQTPVSAADAVVLSSATAFASKSLRNCYRYPSIDMALLTDFLRPVQSAASNSNAAQLYIPARTLSRVAEISKSRHAPVVMQHTLAPPTSPPAPPQHFDGGGGHGDGDNEFLRVVGGEEQAMLLNDWIGRCRIYKMTDDQFLRDRHAAALEVMQTMSGLSAHDSVKAPRTTAGTRRLMLGLFDPQRVHALAAAEISTVGTLVVTHIALKPSEYNVVHTTAAFHNEDCCDTNGGESTAALRLLCGLNSLARAINVPLDLTPLKNINKGRFWLTGLTLLAQPPGE